MPQKPDTTIVLMGIEYRLDRVDWGLPAQLERRGTVDMFAIEAIMEALRNLTVPLDGPSLDDEGYVVRDADVGFLNEKTIEFPKKTPSVKES